MLEGRKEGKREAGQVLHRPSYTIQLSSSILLTDRAIFPLHREGFSSLLLLHTLLPGSSRLKFLSNEFSQESKNGKMWRPEAME